MNLAILTVSQLDGCQEQTLLIGMDNEVLQYHRLATGSKGRGQKWDREGIVSTAPISYEPIAVVLSDRDIDLVRVGQVTATGVKALYAVSNATPINGRPHNEVVLELTNRLIEGDSTLSDYIADKRRTTAVSLNPIGVVMPSASVPTEQKHKELLLQMVNVPPKKWAEQYINRKVIGNITDFEIMDYAMNNDLNVLVEGHAGSGKTSMVQAYASDRGYRYFNVACHIGLEHSHLVGRWIPTPDGHFRWQDGAVTEIVRNGGVLLFNEINFAPERFLTFIFSLLDYRREIQLMENGGELIKAHPKLLIVADMNPDYRGTRSLNQALADRFAIRLQFPYDNNIESRLIKNKGLLQMAKQLRDEFDKGAIVTPISTRSLMNFVSNAKQFGMEFAIYNYSNTFEGDEERNSVRLVLRTYYDNIAQELGLPLSSKPIDEKPEPNLIEVELNNNVSVGVPSV